MRLTIEYVKYFARNNYNPGLLYFYFNRMKMLSLAGRWGRRMKSYVLAEMKNGKLVEATVPHQAHPLNIKGKIQ